MIPWNLVHPGQNFAYHFSSQMILLRNNFFYTKYLLPDGTKPLPEPTLTYN